MKDLAEEARISIRNIRRDANKQADVEQTDKILTEDDLETLQRGDPVADQAIRGQVNELAEKKSAEIMEV